MADVEQPFRDAADLQAMTDLLLAARPVHRLHDYPGRQDLWELLQLAEAQANTCLWRGPDGRLAAFAIVDLDLGNLLFEVAPWAGEDAAAKAIAWGVRRVRETRSGEALRLDTCCAEDDAPRLGLLARHGFVMQVERTLRLARPLDVTIPAPQWPAGFRLGCVTGEDQVDKYVALHQAAFGTRNMTVDMRLGIMRAPGYDPELDLIAIAPDGAWAAFCVCQIHAAENAATGRRDGWTDPIGTHPGFRRRGLARALLVSGLGLMKQRGMDTALLGTLNTNRAMRRLADSVGFQRRSTIVWLSKSVPKS